MKRLGLCLSILLLFAPSTNAQNKENPSADALQVRSTVTSYIEAYYTGDAHRMEQTLHPDYLKHMIHGSIPMRDKTGEQMVAEIKKNGPADLPSSQKTEQVSVLDIAGDIATAKLVNARLDGLHDPIEGEWRLEDSFRRAANRLVFGDPKRSLG